MILGPEVERFESAAAAIAGARFGIGMSSGTDAILAALMALGIGPGDEVICPAFTFFATAGCIARVGAQAGIRGFLHGVLQCGSQQALTAHHRRAPKPLFPLHLFGQAADMDPILEIARRHGLAVIEDAAQAFGARFAAAEPVV